MPEEAAVSQTIGLKRDSGVAAGPCRGAPQISGRCAVRGLLHRTAMAAPPKMLAVWRTGQLAKLIGSFLYADHRGELQVLGLLSITVDCDRYYRWGLLLEWLELREQQHRREQFFYNSAWFALQRQWTRAYGGLAPNFWQGMGAGPIIRVRPQIRRGDEAMLRAQPEWNRGLDDSLKGPQRR